MNVLKDTKTMLMKDYKDKYGMISDRFARFIHYDDQTEVRVIDSVTVFFIKHRTHQKKDKTLFLANIVPLTSKEIQDYIDDNPHIFL